MASSGHLTVLHSRRQLSPRSVSPSMARLEWISTNMSLSGVEL